MRGGQWQVLRLHRGLLEQGHDSCLLVRKGSPLLEHGGELLHPARLPQMSRRFDLVHAHDARSHTLGALLASAPLVVSRRVAFPVRSSAASRWKYRKPDLFLAVSYFVAGELKRAGVDEERIGIVYDGVPVPPEPARGDAILVPDTDDPEKGRSVAEAAAGRVGLTLRRSSNPEADMPGAKALVYLSRCEGLGSGILLGMAHGLTVIASNVGGIPELIEDGCERNPGSERRGRRGWRIRANRPGAWQCGPRYGESAIHRRLYGARDRRGLFAGTGPCLNCWRVCSDS